MLYMCSKCNATGWLVKGTTTLLASYRNGPTTRPNGKWPEIKLDEQLEWLSGNNHMTVQL